MERFLGDEVLVRLRALFQGVREDCHVGRLDAEDRACDLGQLTVLEGRNDRQIRRRRLPLDRLGEGQDVVLRLE